MYKNDIGSNAGDIWRLLEGSGSLTIQEIVKRTSFRKTAILMALGWLAREGKIKFWEKGGYLFAELDSALSEMYY